MLRTFYTAAVAAAFAAGGAGPSHAQTACPSGYHFQAPASCISTRAPTCPGGYHLSANRTGCLIDSGGPQTRVASCPAGYAIRRAGDCASVRPASCPAGKRIEPRTGRCVTGIVQ